MPDAALVCPACGVSRDDGPPAAEPAPASAPDEPEWGPPRVEPHRPVWVYLVVGAYVLLAVTITFGPVLVAFFGGSPEGILTTLVYAAVLLVCGSSLVVIPVRAARDLPSTQRSIWFPLLGSATLAAVLFGGLAIAAHEFAFGGKGQHDAESAAMDAIWVALPLVWLGWGVLFGVMAFRTTPERFAGRLYKTLLAGSALELLVAIPMHMVVRQRGYCCAGFGTGLGIGIGLLVMLVALGPAIVFLFYRRYQQAYVRHRSDSE
jgi:hypothetical protein